MFSIIGTLPLFYFLDDYRYNIGIEDQILVLTVLFYSSVNIIFFLVGAVFIRKVTRLQPVIYDTKYTRPLNLLQKQVLIGFFAFSVLVLIKYLSQLDQIAILISLSEGADAARQARSDMGSSFSGKYHWYKLVMHDLGNLLTFTTFALWLHRKRFYSFIAFIATFTYSTIVAIIATEKAPFAWLLIGLFMTYYLVKNNGFVPFKKMALFAVGVIGILMLAYIVFMDSDNAKSALWSVFSRAFSGSISPAYFYLEFFPAHQDYLLGRTFPNPGGIMPYETYRYTVEVMNWLFPALAKSGVVGSAPTVFWGEAYANFGPIGIPVVAFTMGCIIAVISYLVSKFEINALSTGFIVWLILTFKDLSVTGFSGYLYSVYIIMLSFIVILVFSLRGYILLRKPRGRSLKKF